MSIDPKLIEILACPGCKKKVEVEPERILCRNCHLAFPIRQGIPIMLLDEAAKLEAGN